MPLRPAGSHLTLRDALVLGVVEGLTEFLPISSTGHLIITGDVLGLNGALAKTFEIFIQLGAILAVVWLYRQRLWAVGRHLGRPQSRSFVLNLLWGFLPAAIAGLTLHRPIKAHLFNSTTVALALIVGGVVILVVEWRSRSGGVERVDDIAPLQALKVGLAQTLALIPGVSRAGATIIGGMLLGLSRTTATEFSFFLALPTIGAATVFDLYTHRSLLSGSDALMFAVGTVTALITAAGCIRWLITYVGGHDFKGFGFYRVGFGVLVLFYFTYLAR